MPDLSETTYERKAPLEAAPEKTDCLTSIHYLFLKALKVDLPMTLIGDMPRLLASSGWEFHLVDQAELKSGDLMFLKRRDNDLLIGHAALVLKADRIFHCKRDNGGMVVELIDRVFETYEQKIQATQLKYIDIRNEELRKKHNGCYLKDGCK